MNFLPFLKYEKWEVFICLDCRIKHDAEVGGQPSSLFPAWSSFGCKCSFNSALNCEKGTYIHRTFGNEVQLLTNPRLKQWCKAISLHHFSRNDYMYLFLNKAFRFLDYLEIFFRHSFKIFFYMVALPTFIVWYTSSYCTYQIS